MSLPTPSAPSALRLAAALVLAAGLPAVAAEDETRETAGLNAPVEVLTDRWGVDHIYAENEDDLFFVQGYRAAENRLFQFEMWRRQATGTVAEILGPSELQRDIGTRLHRFRKDMGEEMRWYHPRGDRIIPAFVRGVNAAIARARRNPDALPARVPAARDPPRALDRGGGDLAPPGPPVECDPGAELRDGGGGDRPPRRSPTSPGSARAFPRLELDPAIDSALLKPEILDIYRAFRGPVIFRPEQIAEEYRNRDAERQALLRELPSELTLVDLGEQIGSNNWVAHGERTWTGLPLIVNDPHRTIVAPSLRYFVHLEAPGWHVIGGGEPVLPGLSIGHNRKGGWGLTVFGQDNEDLMVYDTNPDDPNRYRYLGEWEAMTVRTEMIPVKGADDHRATLKYTRHGPVVYEDLETTRRMRSAPPGSRSGIPRISPACGWTRRRPGKSSSRRATTAGSPPKT